MFLECEVVVRGLSIFPVGLLAPPLVFCLLTDYSVIGSHTVHFLFLLWSGTAVGPMVIK